MATIGLTFFLIGLGEFIFGGEPKMMITEELLLPYDSITFFDDMLILQGNRYSCFWSLRQWH